MSDPTTFEKSISGHLTRVATGNRSLSPADLQSQVEAWRLSQPDLILCPLCSEPITLRGCLTRQEGKKHYWKKVNTSTDNLEIHESFWKCQDLGCPYYKLPDITKRAQCYRGPSNTHPRALSEALNTNG